MNVLALVPSWNSAPCKCKDREKWGALSKVKKMPGCVCSSINPSMPEKLKPAVGYPGNMSAPAELRKYREVQTGGLLRALISWSAPALPGPHPPIFLLHQQNVGSLGRDLRLRTGTQESGVRIWATSDFFISS